MVRGRAWRFHQSVNGWMGDGEQEACGDAAIAMDNLNFHAGGGGLSGTHGPLQPSLQSRSQNRIKGEGGKQKESTASNVTLFGSTPFVKMAWVDREEGRKRRGRGRKEEKGEGEAEEEEEGGEGGEGGWGGGGG